MSSSKAAGAFGALAVVAIPAAVIASRYVGGVTLLRSLYVSVPAAFVLALIAVACARRARFARARSVRPGSGGAAAFLAWAGLYMAVVGGLALAIYGALRSAQ